MKHKLILVGGLTLCLAAGCGERADPKKSEKAEVKIDAVSLSDNLAIGALQCKDMSLPDPGAISAVRAIQWIEPSRVEIKSDGLMNCGSNVVRGAYAVIGNRIELGYEGVVKRDGPVPACLCKFELTYSISGLERRDYEVVIEDMNDRKDAWIARVKR